MKRRQTAKQDAVDNPTTKAPKARRGTSYDVALAAGVSQSAVSRAFRPGTSVAPETKARIMLAAKRLGYRPNAIAQGLITRRSHLVAVVISNLTNLHYPEVLAELTRNLSDRGMRVLLFTLRQESKVDEVLDQIWRFQVDGAIVAARLTAAQLQMFEAEDVPLVLYNRVCLEQPVASVSCEFAAGEQLLVDGLVRGGSRRFAIIGGPPDSSVGEVRVAGSRERLHNAGITDVPFDRGDFSYDGGRAAANRLLGAHAVDAIIAANDSMALGAMDAARLDHGLRIPDDVSIVGFDGVGPAFWGSYQLTTVRQPVRRMTAAAVSMVMERMENRSLGAERRYYCGDLVRGATARLLP
jgi:DNA-binding LacI/PurR family transcriptional regulator